MFMRISPSFKEKSAISETLGNILKLLASYHHDIPHLAQGGLFDISNHCGSPL